ncbi:alpha/beta hydrolase [Maribacter algarum]|uniref:Alpha/beta hydrolase n=1 Tax=Maribacter algarum (ex Zhang et al. 2020) TaxID=2578118 RepID=A0A5S3Q998_9FLAO|nr:alpha/beta hydrolase [Maribacter algarum]TMM53613.1 alpha/beta hydrolase [Maribacter algarum]
MKIAEIDGNQIEYEDFGKGNHMLFIHGAFASGKTWRKVIPELSKHFHCIVPEWPFGGHKIPISSRLDFSPVGIADLISKFLRTLDLRNVIIVANDTGGAYAQVFTAKYGERVTHLILSNCEGFEVFPPKKFKSLKSLVKIPGYLWVLSKVFSYKPSLKWDMTFGLLSHTLKKEEIFDLYVKYFVASKRIRRDFKKLAIEWHPKYTAKASKELTEFDKPTLILWGMDDLELFPIELGKRLHSIFSNSTFVEISNSKTYVQEDNPQIFIASIKEFVKDLPNGKIPYEKP